MFLYFKSIISVQGRAAHREGSELSLKRVKREQIEEEEGNHRGLSATEPSIF
jgi:hypothetical protein